MDVSVKFQINMAMHDVSNMAHVDHFSHIVVPMMWFEISMPGLPQGLHNRFVFYLNILPLIVSISLYSCYIAGVVLLIWATIRAGQQLKKNLELAHNVQQVISIVSAGPIYAPCEIQKILEIEEEDETDHILKVRKKNY